MKALAQNYPGLNIDEEEAACDGSNQQGATSSPVDVSRAQAVSGKNAPNSSRSTHNPVLEKANDGGATGNGGRKSV